MATGRRGAGASEEDAGLLTEAAGADGSAREAAAPAQKPVVTVECLGERHRVSLPDDPLTWDEVQVWVRVLLANVVGLCREQAREAAQRRKGAGAGPGSSWRQEVHRAEIRVALDRLRALGALTT